MKQHIVILACFCGALAYALPVPNSDQENIDLVQIPLTDGKELDILTLGETDRLSERNKRTIGILRDLFPELTKQVDDSVNKIVGQLIRAIGPTIFRSAVTNNNPSTRSRTSFDSDFDDDDNDDSMADTSGTRVKIELPEFNDDEDDDSNNETNNVAGASTEPSVELNKQEDQQNSDSSILSVSLNRNDSNNDDDNGKKDDNNECSIVNDTEINKNEENSNGNCSLNTADKDNDATTIKSDDSNII